jgi:hypothetical protein
MVMSRGISATLGGDGSRAAGTVDDSIVVMDGARVPWALGSGVSSPVATVATAVGHHRGVVRMLALVVW